MTVNAHTRENILRTISQGAGTVVAIVSFLVFFSEALAIGPANQVLRLIPLRPNQQALIAMILGIALYCAHVPSPRVRRVAQGVAGLAALYCLSVVATYLFGWPMGVGELVFPQRFGALSGLEISRMTLPSAIELALFGAALALADRQRGWPSDILALTSLVYIFISTLIVTLRIQHVYGTAFTLPGGVLVLIVLGVGVLLAHPHQGILKTVAGETMVGVLLRRLIPTVLLAPTLIAWAWAEGQRLGLYAAPEGMFFAMLAMLIVLLCIVGWNIVPLARLERARDEALSALCASETQARRLAAIVEASEDAISTYDPETWTLTFWSRGAEKLWGWSAEEALKKRGGFLTREEESEKFCQAFADLKDGKPVKLQDIKAYHKDGTPIFVSVSIFPIRDAHGRIVAFASIQRDVTELRQVLIDVSQRTAELKKSEELNQLKDYFLSTISHEMKTPLCLITGYTELLEDACPDETILEGIKDGSRRLSEHIDNILDYSALISGTLPLYKTEVNLAEVVGHVEDVMKQDFEQKDISLEMDVSSETPPLEGDFRRICQILSELLENAQKFTPEGGKAGVRVSPEGDQVRLDVWNTGEGIPEEDFGRIWEAFSQLATADAFRKGGLGLGLTIVKRLVELHGGRVAVASQVGQGTTFTVYLPVGNPLETPGPSGAPGAGRQA